MNQELIKKKKANGIWVMYYSSKMYFSLRVLSDFFVKMSSQKERLNQMSFLW
jgi:hypothetical protein